MGFRAFRIAALLKHFLVISVFCLLSLTPGRAANETHRLAYIEKLDLEISYLASKSKWCAPRLDLVLTTSKKNIYTDEGFLNGRIAKLVKKLRDKCQEIQTVTISGFSRAQPENPIVSGNYSKANEWQFAQDEVAKSALTEKAESDATGANSEVDASDLAPLPKSEYVNLRDNKSFPLEREIAFRVIFHNPELLDNDKIIENWLRAEAFDKQSPVHQQVKEIYKDFKEGTKFDQEDVIFKFRKFLKKQVRKKSEELGKPLALKIGIRSGISGEFDREKGFPQQISSGLSNAFSYRSSSQLGRYLSMRVSHIGTHINVPLLKRANFRYLPITDVNKARKIAKLLQNKQRYKFDLSFYLQISKIVSQSNINRDGLLAKSSWDRLELELRDQESLGAKLVYAYELERSKSNVDIGNISENSANIKFDPSKYEPINFENLSRELAMRAVYGRQVKLSDSVVLRWMQADAASRGTKYREAAVEYLSAYKQGTSFEKEDILKKFRRRLVKEIKARGESLKQDLWLQFRAQARILDDYNPNRGFKQRDPDYDNINLKSERISSDYFYLLNNFDSSILEYLPILNRQNARKFARLLKDDDRYEFYRHYYVRIKKVDWDSGSYNRVNADVKVDHISLRMTDRRNPDQPSRLVFSWPNPEKQGSKITPAFEAAAVKRISPLEFARRANMKVLHGHLDLDARNTKEEENRENQNLINIVRLQDNEYSSPFVSNRRSKGFNHLQNLMAFEQSPGLLQNAGVRNAAVKLYASSRQKNALGKRGLQILSQGFSQAADEFELNEHIQKLKSIDIEARLERLIPEYPVPAIRRTTVELGQYNFETESFPIMFDGKLLSSYSPTMNDFIVDDYLLVKYPGELKLSPGNAKKLLSFFKKQQNRNLHLAVFLEIQEKTFTTGSGSEVSRYFAVPNKVALYLDEGLTKKVKQFEVGPLSREVSVASLEAESREQEQVRTTTREFLSILKKPIADTQTLALAVNRLKPGEDYLKRFFVRSDTYKNAHELENADVLQRQITQAQLLDVTTGEFWLYGWAFLGRYDLDRKGFAINQLDIQATWRDRNRYDVNFENFIINAGDFQVAPVDKALAKRILDSLGQYNPNRKFTLRALVEPVSASFDDSGNYLETKISYFLKKLIIISGDEDDQPEDRYVIATITGTPADDSGADTAEAETGQSSSVE